MAVYYVSPGGDNGDPGTRAQPWQTIAYAITQVADSGIDSFESGDTVILLPGTYVESDLSCTARGTVWRADDLTDLANRPVIDCTGGSEFMRYRYGTYRSLDIIGAGVDVWVPNAVKPIQVEDCRIIGAALVCDSPTAGSRFRRLEVRDCDDFLAAVPAGNIRVEACLLVDVTGGIEMTLAGHVVEHCTVIRGGDGANPLINGSNQLVCRNTIAVDGTAPHGIKALTYDNCCSYSSDPATYHTVANYFSAPDDESIEDPPIFLDPSDGDYRLHRTSPCREMGSTSATVSIDLRLEAFGPRVAGATPTAIGCYAFLEDDHAELLSEAYRDGQLNLLPPGRWWSRHDVTGRLATILRSWGVELARLDRRIEILLDEMDPRTTGEMLDAWERVLDLPGSCVATAPDTLAERRAALWAAYVASTGASIEYWVELAATLGYTLEIIEPTPARADYARAEDRCYGWRYWYARADYARAGDPIIDYRSWLGWWIAWITDSPTFAYARADYARAGDRIRTWADEVLECLFTAAKPAHTLVAFYYGS